MKDDFSVIFSNVLVFWDGSVYPGDIDDTSASYLERNFLRAPVMCVNNVQPFSLAFLPFSLAAISIKKVH